MAYKIRTIEGAITPLEQYPVHILVQLREHLEKLGLNPVRVTLCKACQDTHYENGELVEDVNNCLANSYYKPGTEQRATGEIGVSLPGITHTYAEHTGWRTHQPMMTEDDAEAFVRQPWSVG